MSAKTFEPTPSRLTKARREGDAPVSHDAVAVAAFAAALATLWLVGRPWAAFAASGLAGTNIEHARVLAVAIFAPSLAICIGASAGTLVATLVQKQGFGLHPLRWKLGFQVPLNRSTLASAARSAGATLAAAIGAFACAKPGLGAIATALWLVAGVGAVSAGFDLVLVRSAWRRRLRMSHDELRRDLRESEGDPELKGRRRRMHRTVVRGSLREVRRATFVVVNPTHVAVAVRYAPPEVAVPAIVVRAVEEGALRVRAAARDANVPLIENATLARELYRVGSLGPIPRELYLAVAQVVASILRT
ncbi:MAG: EscU/YscU/HrcU family type III secretion system export apparatus switch protein [Candidatus Eremiobacteraeota bacterium]|nr:EscU/YscU/HrcU family type III secretion system export apparatus switch protein [Candidatus Eremiobacteraeota bacterium]